ncbi:hypothetical protein [Kitasatospora purpeofusca]|uniref:hypothetical protein n=1 Tax=Kitasatospora purpeofusca TaxID=67352 RepID=UPI002A5AFC92|nr:hypothetical protein [Kitasatospora purpeofusca]MDY0810785.1 hypothetical protein [Kitasatospora purpeofusca]
MAHAYTLTLHNRSPQPDLTFAVFAVLPVNTGQRATPALPPPKNGAANVYPLVWLSKALAQGHRVDFTWTPDFSLAFAGRPCRENHPWRADNDEPLPVVWDDTDRNSAVLDRPGSDYTLARSEDPHPLHRPRVFLDTTGSIPPWHPDNGPSVALAAESGELDHRQTPTPAIATDSGPNLLHTFDLAPDYYIHAGQDPAATMLPLDTVTGFHPVPFPGHHRTAEWTLNEANLWVEGAPDRTS